MKSMIEIEKVTLERMQYCISQYIDTALLDHGNVDGRCVYDHATQAMCMTLTATVAGKLLRTISATYPADWLSAFKLRWFPEWSLRWFPVRMKQITLDAHELYAQVSLPEHSPTIHIEKLEKNFNWKGVPPV